MKLTLLPVFVNKILASFTITIYEWELVIYFLHQNVPKMDNISYLNYLFTMLCVYLVINQIKVLIMKVPSINDVELLAKFEIKVNLLMTLREKNIK